MPLDNQNPLSVLKNFHPFFEGMVRLFISQSIRKAFPELISFDENRIKIEHPLQENYGDYSTSVGMVLAKDLHKSPKEISEKIISVINDLIKKHQTISVKSDNKDEELLSLSVKDVLENISIAGSGFINITLKPGILITYISSLLEDKNIGKGMIILKGRKIIVEFADPNPFKEFHIGHLRNISLGESYARLFEYTGATVRRANYQGDVGMHVAKCLYGIKKIKNTDDITDQSTPKQKAEFLGKSYSVGATAFEGDPEAKKEIIELNKKVYDQDPSLTGIWKKYRAWSLEYFDTIYARVGTKFERFYFESEVGSNGMKIVKSHIKDGVFEESEGAVVYKGEKKGLHTRVFISKENYPTYEGKDLGLAVLKEKEWPFDLSIIMTGNEQEPYFKVMLSALSDIEPVIASKTIHVPFGMVNLKEGKMSSRTGHVITADWLLNEAKRKIEEIMKNNRIKNEQRAAESATGNRKSTTSTNHSLPEEDMSLEQIKIVSEKLAIAAVKYSMLKVGAPSDIAFNIDESISLEGDSGPYVMYTFARCKSVFRKLSRMSKGKNSGPVFDGKKFQNKTILLSKEESQVLRTLYKFPEIILDATRNFSPNGLCSYLFDLCQKYNGFYQKHSILGEPETSEFRLWLTDATSRTIQKGLYLLGIETIDRM